MIRPYAKMSTGERWQWHSEVYAFRRVVLGLHEDQHPSPTDPRAEWIDEGMIVAAENRLLAKRAKIDEARKRAAEARDREMARGGRAIVNAWAKARGHADIDAYAAANGMDWSDAYGQVIADIMASGGTRRMPTTPYD